MKRGHRRQGSTPVDWRSAGGLIAATVLAAVLLLAVFPVTAAPPLEPAASGDAVRDNAATLYLQNCASCHGPSGQGTAAGPPLVDSGAAAADFYLRTGRMPLGAPGQRPVRQEPRFDDAQIRALVDYVAGFGDGPPIPQVAENGDVQRGWKLYSANCAACHAATGAGNAVGGGFFAIGLGQATDEQVGEATIVAPGVMPRFAFSDAERADLIAYIRYLRTSPTPGGAPIGGIGPVAEGFVAVFAGLSALVAMAVFVGHRWRAVRSPVERTVKPAVEPRE